MDITLTLEIETMIRQHLAHGCSGSPETVLAKALRALSELETMQSRHDEATVPDEAEVTPPPEPATQVSPLVQWMRETAGPAVGLQALRRRLAKIPGLMSDDLAHEREDRF